MNFGIESVGVLFSAALVVWDSFTDNFSATTGTTGADVTDAGSCDLDEDSFSPHPIKNTNTRIKYSLRIIFN